VVECDIVTDEPKLNVEVHAFDDDDVVKEEGSHKNPTQVQTVSVADILESSEPCDKELTEKEPMDFEACISVNEISKYDKSQGKVSEEMDLTYEDENAGSRTLVVDQHMMDFEVEISASHISKPKQIDDRIECNTQVSAENKIILSEMEEVTIRETAETEQIAMEKLVQKDGDISIELTCTDNIPGSLQQDGTVVMELTMVEEDILHDRTVGNAFAQEVVQELDITKCEIKARKTSGSSSPSVDKLQLSSDFEMVNQNVKPCKTSIGASSFQRDILDVNAECKDMKVCINNEATTEEQNTHYESCDEEGKIHRATVEGCSVQREKSPKTEPCEVEVAVDVVEFNETRGNEPQCRASSVHREDVPSDEIATYERKLCKRSSSEGSVVCENIPSVLDGHDKKVHRRSSRANSVHSDDTETCEGKVRKTRSRASSVCEDIPTTTDSRDKRVHRSSSWAGSVEHEDIPSDENETYEGKVCKLRSRASYVQRIVAADETVCDERGIHKPKSRSGTIQSNRKYQKRISRGSSVQHEDVQFDDSDDNVKAAHKFNKRGDSAQKQVVPTNETESVERKTWKHNLKAGSVHRLLEVIEEEESQNTAGGKPDSVVNSVYCVDIPSEKAPSGICKAVEPETSNSVKCIDVTEEDSHYRPISRANSVDCIDITAADFACNENRLASAPSVNSDASTVAWEENAHLTGRTRKNSASSRCSSVEGDDGKDTEDIKMHSNRNSQAGVIQENIVLEVNEASEEMVESTKKTEGSSRGAPEDGTDVGMIAEGPFSSSTTEKVDNFRRKAKKKCSQAGPSHSNFGTNTGRTLEVKYLDLEDSNAKIEDNSVSEIIRESKDVKDRIKKSSASGAISGKLNSTPTSAMHRIDLATETGGNKEKTSRASCKSLSVSNQPYRKARSECEYVVVPNIEKKKRFTRSTLGISTRTTSTDTGSVTDNSASSKKSRRSDIGSEMQWKGKACSPTRGDSLKTQQAIEEYATNRRLTRHQRSVLERSLELIRSPLSQPR
jgi:hypothetical protein